MKKMMMIVAALVVAVGAQAASIDWNLTGNAMSDTKGSKLSEGTVIYLIDNKYADGIKSAIDAGSFGSGTAGILDFAPTWGTKGQVSARTATSDLLQAAFDSEGNRYKYDYAIVFQDPIDKDQYFFSGVQSNFAYNPASSDLTFNTPLTVIFGLTAKNEGSWYTAVPEPTSAALLALGLVAFGLRRKSRA